MFPERLFKGTLALQLKTTITDPEGRYIIVMCHINAQPYTVVALYAPKSHQVSLIRKLLKQVSTVNHGHLF